MGVTQRIEDLGPASGDTAQSVVAIVASHNRRPVTVDCLRAFFALTGGFDLSVVLVDDGSTDGTGDAARLISDRVEVVNGSGSLFWARAMAIAERRAMERRPDNILWLNDDVLLDPDALVTLVAARGESSRCIVVGWVADPISGVPSYGGVERIDWHPLRYRLVAPTDGEPRIVTTFAGNVVLVSRPVYTEVAGIDGGFAHAHADWDYGLRARRHGIYTVVTGRSIGTCPVGAYELWLEPGIPLRERGRRRFGPKGHSPRSMARYLRRHGGPVWPIFWFAPFARFAGHVTLTTIRLFLCGRPSHRDDFGRQRRRP
jgi:GT2 family glycosyltransferase